MYFFSFMPYFLLRDLRWMISIFVEYHWLNIKHNTDLTWNVLFLLKKKDCESALSWYQRLCIEIHVFSRVCRSVCSRGSPHVTTACTWIWPQSQTPHQTGTFWSPPPPPDMFKLVRWTYRDPLWTCSNLFTWTSPYRESPRPPPHTHTRPGWKAGRLAFDCNSFLYYFT